MQDTSMISGKTMGRCAACGKEIPIRDVRSGKPQYCDRKCAANARFMTRYRGTMSGPMDRPSDPMSKNKFLA